MLFQTSNASSNMTLSSSSLIVSSGVSKNNAPPLDDWLMGGAVVPNSPISYDDSIASEDETDVSGSEINFDLERIEHRGSDHVNDPNGVKWSISKPDLQKQNRLGGEVNVDVGAANHRLLVILITVLSVSFIFFSILISIAIALCVYRNKRYKTQSNSNTNQQVTNQSKTNNNNLTSKPNSPPFHKPNQSQHSSPVTVNNNICTYDNYHHHHNQMTPDIIPCEGVLIFNPQSDISNTVATVAYGPNANSQLGPQGPVYRDFVSLDSDSSYANFTASDGSNSGQQAVGNMTLHTLDPVSIPNESNVEPKFLCQPNHVSILNDHLNNAGYLSGQLVTTTTGQAYSMDSGSSGTQFNSPFHLVNGPFLSIQSQTNSIGHRQHYNPSQQSSQMVFMAASSQQPNHMIGDDHSSGQSQINSSFSLSEVSCCIR